MKRKIAFSILSIATIGGASSCFTWGQDDLLGPARALSTAVRRFNTSNGAETFAVTGSGDAFANVAVLDTKNADVDQPVDKLVQEFKSAEGTQKESLLAKLSVAVGNQFDQRQESKAKELKALEEQLAKLREIQAKRTQQRERIVGDRVKQILHEVEGLGWGTEGSESTGLLRFPGGVMSRSSPRPLARSLGSLTTDPIGIPPSVIPVQAIPVPAVPSVPVVPTSDRR